MGLKHNPANVIGYKTTFGKKECGVYTFTDTVTGKVYVGSTVNLHRRKIQHLSGLCNNRHFNKSLQDAFNGPGDLELDFIPVDKVLSNSDSLRTIRELERSLIEENLAKGTLMNRSLDPNCPGKGVSPSEETRSKIKVAMTGRYVSDDTRKKRSDTMFGSKHSADRRKNISSAMTKYVVEIDGVRYNNASDAAKKLNIGSSGMVRKRCLSPNYPNYRRITE